MRCFAIIALAGAIALSPARSTAQDEKVDLSSCATLTSDLDRLACYDKISGKTPASEVSKDSKSDWVVRTEVSKLSDKEGVFLTLPSIQPVSCRWNQNAKAFLTIRCHDDTTAFYISAECHMVSSQYNDYGDVTYRIDSAPAAKLSLDESTDNKSLGAWNGGKAIPFIKKLIPAKKLIVQFTPYNENPKMAEFNIAGLDSVVEPLRKQCGW
ncbi:MULTISPECIES: type VI secretion system-associated protein TagO [Rhizobium/Agrobacterium group]|uniref:type VI secretion system-associated protein TagO n=1 Tax=Rhizobium/Agrobacterium group TaxID=227290 RepID=UPI001436CA3E|nr:MULTISPECIES: type VI secretion system-associated protein TagO [Rhizobium/Agrobacterium group]MBB4402534.1 type VI secretion system protein VasI [Agrobacterium radiobacter]MBB5588688.1 type VI secretion system protein VasI [Agrobacterium radiobacter]